MTDEPKLEVLGGADFQAFMTKLIDGAAGHGCRLTAKEADFILACIRGRAIVPEAMITKLTAGLEGPGCVLTGRETQMAMVAVGRTLDAAPKVSGRGPPDDTVH